MIELRNLTKIFNLGEDEKDRKVALDHVNLKINDGEFVTIIGSNGSGKTTTMNLIAGTYEPTEGEILLSGMPISQMKEFKRANYFGRVFQDPRMGTTAEMTVLENLEIAYRRGKHHSPFKWGFSNEVVAEYFKSQVKRFGLGLEERMNQKVGKMSGGQRQALTLLMAANDPRIDTRREFLKMNYDIASGKLHVELNNTDNKNKRAEIKKELKALKKTCIEKAGNFYDEQKAIFLEKNNEAKTKEEKLQALVELSTNLHGYNQDNKIMLLDEHTAALDPKTAKKVLELTNEIVRAKCLTTLMITHNMKDALTYGDRLIMFHRGHILYDLNKEEKSKLKVEDLLAMFEKAEKQSENE